MAAWALEAAGIVANRQTVPGEKRSPYYPSGLRLGTPAVTTRGMKEREMKLIAYWIHDAIKHVEADSRWADIGHVDRERDQKARKLFKEYVWSDSFLISIARDVRAMCYKFPCP